MKTLTTPFTFFIEGTPRPKQSFKVGKRNYLPEPVRTWQELVGWSARASLNRITGWAGEMIKGPVKIELAFYMPEKRRVDGDNLEKGVMDGLKGVIIKDDDIWTVPSMVKNFFHVSESPDGLAGVSVRIEPYVGFC